MTWFKQREHSLVDTVGKSPTEWWLVYSNLTKPYWWARLFKRGYQHVGAVRRDGRVWVYVDPCFEFTDVHIIRSDEPLHVLFQGAILQRVVAMRKQGRFRAPMCSYTCVEVVKGLLGIDSVRVQTPWQLFKYCKVMT